MNTYHYSLEGKPLGPVNLDQLKSLNITKETLVWKEGLRHWVRAEELEELEVLFKAVPPPLNQTGPPPLQSTVTVISEDAEEKRERRQKILIWSGIALGLLVFIILVMNIGKSKKSNNNEQTPSVTDVPTTEYAPAATADGSAAPAAESYQNKNTQTTYSQPKKAKKKTEDELRQELYNKEIKNPKTYISASFSSRVNLAVNTVIEGNLYNSATLANFKNVKIKVRFFSKTGAELNSETFTIMEFLPAGGSVYFKHKIYGWTPKVDYLDYTIISAEEDYQASC